MSASSDDNVVESGSRDSGDDLSKRASSTPPDFDKPDIDVPVGDSTDPFDDVDWKPKSADSSLPELDEHESTPVDDTTAGSDHLDDLSPVDKALAKLPKTNADEAASVDDKTAPAADSAAPQINSESSVFASTDFSLPPNERAASSEAPTADEQGAAPVDASEAANSVKQEAAPVDDDTVPAQDMWQVELDKALLDLDLPPRERLELLQKALKNENLVDDVREALSMVQDRGFMDGHPDAIQKLFPSGTQSRKDLEQLQALRKQLPEAFEELQRQVKDAPRPTIGSSSVPTPPDPREVTKFLGQSVKSIAELLFDKDKQKEFLEEAKDSLRATPKGLETPVYEVKRVLEGPIFLGKPQPIEIREYEEFTVAQTSMGGGVAGSSSEAGGGFNTLASYLFGGNQDKTAMSMTVPVDISQTGDDKRASMSFVLPKKNADSPPTPMEGSGVEIKKVPSRLVVAKAFGGLTTEKEVERQKAAILEALATDGHYEAADAHQISVLSYNSPFTIPWRKRNEVVLVVTAKSEVMA